MRKIETYGLIKNGILKISYRNKFIEVLKEFPDCRIKLIIQKIYNKRSLNQNAYLFGYVYAEVQAGIKEIQGEKYTISQIHEMFKMQFLAKEIVNKNTGEIIKIAGSTATLTTVEMMEYISEITKWSDEWLNVIILEPNEQAELKLKFKAELKL